MNINNTDFLKLYHTNLRNIGLFYTVSIGIITLSHNKILKNNIINELLSFIGIIFLFLTLLLTLELNKIIENYNTPYNLKIINILLRYSILIILILVTVGTLLDYNIINYSKLKKIFKK
jgi:hypothetical protein